MLTDIEIARSVKPLKIDKIAEKLGYSAEEIECYGHYKAKIPADLTSARGKLILVTAMSPTPLGEGKTTMSIGLADAMTILNKKVSLALREPSLGPVFGVKGGACGGGYSQIIPMEDINLHFTGDFHAITSANNLLCAMIDNHIFQGNALNIKRVIFARCTDTNDRALRNVMVSSDGKGEMSRTDYFSITAASEIMAVLCLATSLENLKERLGNIVIGFNADGREVYARDLKAQNAMAVLLKDAVKPNLVQTLEGTPAVIHGGPFANIAHGCNSIIATKTALARCDYVVTEAGFGAELGGEKFLDIKCRLSGLKPSCVVLVVTARSIKYNGGVPKAETSVENLAAIEKGFANVKRHANNLKNFGQRVIIAINRFYADTPAEIALIKKLALELSVPAIEDTSFSEGGKGATALAEKVIEYCELPTPDINFTYSADSSIADKITAVATKIYGAKSVSYTAEGLSALEKLSTDVKYNNLPICIAKTQYSFSCDQNLLGAPDGFDFEIRDIIPRMGAGFLVVVSGQIMLMPGLSKSPNAERIDINSVSGNVENLS